jgi:hypothetical protein
MTTAEKIVEKVRHMSEVDAERLLEFINSSSFRSSPRMRKPAPPILPSLEDFRKDLPYQAISAGDFCQEMRDAERY